MLTLGFRAQQASALRYSSALPGLPGLAALLKARIAPGQPLRGLLKPPRRFMYCR